MIQDAPLSDHQKDYLNLVYTILHDMQKTAFAKDKQNLSKAKYYLTRVVDGIGVVDLEEFEKHECERLRGDNT